MDHDNKKVFVTGIRRKSLSLKNNLYEIIQKDVAVPIAPQVKDDVRDLSCDFSPSSSKSYIPKKKSQLKVLTVRDVRTKHEENILQTLPNELEKQQKLLLKKIKHGFAKEQDTRTMALNLLKSNSPITRLSWQMLMNLNPEGHTYSSQFILWDRKCIQLNGSKGGKTKFICNYDVCKDKKLYRETTKSKPLNKKKSLLRASLNIRFKPGPLSKKKRLDYSYQKHHVGDVELVNLPRPGLYIQPLYGTPLEPTVKTFLQNLHQEDGTISAKWAEFAASMLGKVTNKVIQIGNENSITFNLNYKYNQSHILMRRDVDAFQNKVNEAVTTKVISPCTMYGETTLIAEVRDVIDRILDSVEISLNQDLMCPAFDEPREIKANSTNDTYTQSKEKSKRRYGELDRLDVTVIRLSESHKKNNTEPCRQIFCSSGCICDSLECNYNLKDHCGRVDCMFKCKCDFSNYRITDSLDGDCSQLYSGLYYLDQKINDNLSKEEQKFHQTVILTDDKSILLKSNRRNWKATKKYADFYSSMRLRSEIKNKKMLSIALTKLNCSNIEPWCMVHNLYKCFCKGKFRESLTYDPTKNEQSHTNNEVVKEQEVILVPDVIEIVKKPEKIEKVSNNNDITEISNPINTIDDALDYELSKHKQGNEPCLCSRVLPYRGRSHTIEYYQTTNKKIIEMEKNDKRLQAKMINIINQSFETERTEDVNLNVNEVVDVANVPFKLDELLFNIFQEQQKLMDSMNSENTEVHSNKNIDAKEVKRLPNRTKLVQWLETSYKKYRERVEKGLWKTSLSPPRSGKVALYPWNFILSRYRERKNLFLVSKQKPFRIFMAVDARNSYFNKCINLNLISKSQLNEYPVMVRNLINNTTDENDGFCILCGLSHCWELVGSVTKVNENKKIQSESNIIGEHFDDSVHSLSSETDLEYSATNVDTDRDLSDLDNAQVSKWFVMTIENDFIEIQFFKKGFFIKYESIVRAIAVSRQFGKTVRLSSQKCNDGSNDPQFGLYAIPNMNDNCVFIGPYEKDEPLGMEALRKRGDVPNKIKTRGLWITVNKVDNAEVINNPLSFMPSFKKGCGEVITFGNRRFSESSHNTKPSTSKDNMELSINSSDISLSKTSTIVKPLKILKPGGFKLPLKILTKPLPNQYMKTRNKVTDSESSSSDSCLESETLRLSKGTDKTMLGISNVTMSELNAPVTEGPPQIKITNVASLCDASDATNINKPDRGMIVLKPEEINERLALNYFRVLQPDEINKSNALLPTFESSSVVKNRHNSSETCCPLMSDVYIISDDEDFSNISPSNSLKDVWILCTNVKNLGWIPGRKNNENKLSFKFPGFTSTDFYDEELAFIKINLVLARKVYVPKNIILKWQVIEKQDDINVEDELTLNYLNADFVLTKRGFVHKNSLVFSGRKRINEDNSTLGNKKRKDEVINAFRDMDKIKIEDLISNLSDDKNTGVVDVFDEKITDEDSNVFGVEKKNEDDINVYGDKEKIDECRKVFTQPGHSATVESTSTRLKQNSIKIISDKVFERDSAD